MNKRTRKILILVLSLCFLASLAGSIWSLLQDRAGIQSQQEAEQTAGIHESEAEPPPQAEILDPSVLDDPIVGVMARVDLDALQAVNPDVLGWISIPDTIISYPFLQGEDNEYYLRRTWQGEKNNAGCIFLDSEVSPDLSDFNTIIYGHRMRNETMFGPLKYYSDPAYWEDHPTIYVRDESFIRRYEIFSAYETDVTAITFGLGFSQQTHKKAFLDFSKSQSVIDTGVEVGTFDRILTLSTCPARGYDTRWIVQAVLRDEIPIAAMK